MASTHRDEISRLELLHAAHPDGLVFPHLADAYRRAGRYAQAENLLTEGLRLHSDFSSAHLVLGRLRLDQGKDDEAATAFRRVLQLDPRNLVALEYLGRLAAEHDRLAEALQHFRRLHQLKPTGEIAEQIRVLERRLRSAAGESGPTDRERPAEGPGVGGDNGRWGSERAAGAEPGEAARTLPEPGEVVTETMAELYARQGLHDRALAVYRQLLERNPGDSRLRAKFEAARARREREEVADPGTSAPQAPEPVQPRSTSAPVTARTSTPVTARASTPVTAAGGEPPSTPAPPPTTIGEQLRSLLGWRPESATAPEPAPDPTAGWKEASGGRSDASPASPGTHEPWAASPVTTGPETDPRRKEPGASPTGESPGGPATGMPGGTRPTPPSRTGWPAARPPGRPAPDRGREGAGATTRRPVPAQVAEAPLPAGDPPERGPEDRPDPEGDAQARTLIALTDLLVGLLEYRDPFFRGGSSLTRLLATNVAEEMGLSASERVNLALAALLRDLGRLAMGGKLVSAQRFGPTPEARRMIERHVDLALHLMEGIELPKSVRLAVRHHHERWDGTGYPDGLAGEEIPLLARILAVVDAFAAMVSPRPYRLPRKVPDAERELREVSGSQFDPRTVNALLRVLARRDQPHLGFVQRHHILLLDPDQPGALVTATKLCSAGYLAEVAATREIARERLRRVPVAALVVSATIGSAEAASLVRELRVDPSFASLPIVVTDAESVVFRVRLLESGADVCFPPGVSYGEIQGTLGALVRRTIRPHGEAAGPATGSGEAPWLALQGDVEDFPMTWLLQVMKYDSRTAGIGVRTDTRHGAIYLEKGDAVHAEIRGGAKGEPALREMLTWKKGRFTVQPDARPRERTIDTSIMHLLLTQAVEEDHASAGIFGAVSPDA